MISLPPKTTKQHNLPLLGLGFCLGLAACSAPGEVPLPGETDLPPKPASLGCSQLGAFTRFANSEFFFADLDNGVSCTQFLEQDQCVLGVFRDCTYQDSDTEQRHWTGRTGLINGQRSVTLSAGYLGSSKQGRAPACCLGPLLPAEGEAEWFLLECKQDLCLRTDDQLHAGFYAARKIDFDPATRTTGSPAALSSPLVAGATDTSTPTAFWLLLQDSLQSWDAGRGSMINSYPIAGQANALAVSSDGVYVGSSDRIYALAPNAAATREAPSGGSIIELIAIDAGLLALRTNGPNQELVLYNKNTLGIVSTSSAAGISNLIPWQGTNKIAAALLNNDQFAVVRADLSTETEFGLWLDGGATGTLFGFTGDVVARSTPMIAVGPQRAAFAAPCHRGDDQACWFEFGGDDKPKRIGLGVASVGTAWLLPDGQRIAFGTDPGQLIVVDRDPARPHLQEVLQFPTSVEHVIGGLDGACPRAWLKLSGENTIVPAHLEDCDL